MCTNNIEQKIIELLQNLEFCNNSAITYVCLLKNGPLTLDALINKTLTTEEKVIPLLCRLIANRLIFEDQGKYWALNPNKSFKSFYNEKIWSLTNTVLNNFQDVPENSPRHIKEVHSTCQQLRKYALKLYSHRPPIQVGRIKVARDPDQFAVLLSEAIDNAEDKILCVSTSPKQYQLSLIWGSLLDRINCGVKYIRIVDIVELIDHGLKIIKRDIENVGVKLYIIEKKRIDRKFYVIDNKYELSAFGELLNSSW